MSNVTSTVHRIFGHPDAIGRLNVEANGQTLAETLAVGTTARRFRGPKANGHFSIHARVASAAGATSVLTFWYSNLPDPDVDTEGHWVQDTGIADIDLTSVATNFVNVGNVNAEWIRAKAVVATTTGTAYMYTRVEGVDNR